MPSPFPGMNPYLEQPSCWESLHDALAFAAAEVIVPQVRPKYLVKPRQRLYIHEADSPRHHLGIDDFGVAESLRDDASVALATHVVAPAYGVIAPAADIERQAYLEIENREEDRVVTTVEILSPSNKRGHRDRQQYLAKRQAVLASDVHLVEIDLLRGGPRMPIESIPESDYCALVSRSYERPRTGIWTWTLMIEGIHDRLGFADYIYAGGPDPVLSDDQQSWADMLLSSS